MRLCRVEPRDRGNYIAAFVIGLLLYFSACSPSYPYLVSNEGCNCQEYTFHDRQRKLKATIRAEYKVGDRITSTIEITFRNEGKDTLDLGQAYVKGTSKNVLYQYNGKSLPLPFVHIEPGDDYTITMTGTDTELVDDPLRKIAGERVIVEITGMRLGNVVMPNLVFTLVPLNPKFSS